MDTAKLIRQRKKGLGCISVYSCINTQCKDNAENTCIAPLTQCVNCKRRIKRSKTS